MKCFSKMLVTALAGWGASSVAMLILFRVVGFGLDGHGILMNPQLQSEKLIAVWSSLEPLPLIITRPLPMITGLYFFAFLHSVVYKLMAPAWRPGVFGRGVRLSLLLFTFSYLFWEFFTPLNLFGEPIPLILLELVFWAAVALAEGFAIAMTAETLWQTDHVVARGDGNRETTPTVSMSLKCAGERA